MTRGRPLYGVVDHTADTGILVHAPDERALFERCAAAMFDLMADLDYFAESIRAGAIVDEFEVEAGDREELLVAWLGELLSFAMVGGLVYAAFEIDRMTPRSLHARAWGAPLDSGRQGFRTELKAVTYHELFVSQDAAGWSAQVIFDV